MRYRIEKIKRRKVSNNLNYSFKMQIKSRLMMIKSYWWNNSCRRWIIWMLYSLDAIRFQGCWRIYRWLRRVRVLRNGMWMGLAYYALLVMIMKYKLIGIITRMRILECSIKFRIFSYICITSKDINSSIRTSPNWWKYKPCKISI